jgi:hypothetical protein
MNRTLRLFLVVCLLSIALAGPEAQPAQASSPLEITQGVWTGTFTRVAVVQQNKYGAIVNTKSRTLGNLNLIITGDAITGSFGSIETEFEYDFTAGGTSESKNCKINAVYTLSGGTVQQGAGGLPILVLDYTGQTNGTGFCNMPQSSSGKMTLPATVYTGSYMAGESIQWSDPSIGMAITNLKASGADVQTQESWELNSKSPLLGPISPGYVRYFLQEIPFENIYATSVDWKGQPPGQVDFTLNGIKKTDTTGGGIVQQPFTIGDQPAGKNPLVIVAVTKEQVSSAPSTFDVILVPQPQWAKNAGLAYSAEGTHLLYKGKIDMPEEPFKASITIPKIIPFIGGEWGILPTQLIANITATSEGGNKNDTITGDGGIGLGINRYKLDISGETTTQMSENELAFLESTAYFKLSPPVTYQKQVGLLDLIPGAAPMYNIFILGSALEALNSIASITGDVGLQVSGKGQLDDDANHASLIFTSGEVRTDASVSVNLRIDPKFAYIQITGKGNGYVIYQIAPDVKATDCSVTLAFLAEAGLAKFLNVNPVAYSKDWNVYSCNGSAGQPNGRLALAQKKPLFPANQPLIQNDQVKLVTLAENADIQAGPTLALGPDGKMAYAWMAANPGEQSSEIRLRWFDGVEWGQESAINSKGAKINFAPSVGLDQKGQIVTVWPQSKAENPVALNEDFARSLDIVYAVSDPKTGKTISQGSLTTDSDLDFSPRIVRSQDGVLWAMWQSSPSASLTGNSGAPNLLKTAFWNGKKWSKVQTAADNLVGTLWWSLAAGNGQALVAYDVDTNGNLTDAADREIFVARSAAWGQPQQLTKNDSLDSAVLAAYTPDGQPVLAWLNGSQVVSLQGNLDGEPAVWFENQQELGLALTRGVLLAGSAGEMGLLLPGESTAGPDTWLYKFDPQAKTWSRQELPLFGNPEVENDLTAGINANGDLLIGLTSVQMLEQDGKPVMADTTTLKAATVQGAFQPIEAFAVESAANSTPWNLLYIGLALLCALAGLGILVAIVLILPRIKRSQKSAQ